VSVIFRGDHMGNRALEISKDNEPVILSAVRTPSGRFQGSLSGFPASKLGALVIRAAVERAGIPDPLEIDEVYMGNVVSAGVGQAPARQAAIFAGLPESVGATALNKVCGSRQGMVICMLPEVWKT
jgi:acetyl-CoA C-acetyltransferase